LHHRCLAAVHRADDFFRGDRFQGGAGGEGTRARGRRWIRDALLLLAVVFEVLCAGESSAIDDGVCLDLDEPAGIEESLDDDEARGRSNRGERLAVDLRDSVAVSWIDEKHMRSYYVTKRRAGLAKRFVDDLQAPSSLDADVGVDVPVGPDRGGCGNEDEVLVADSPAKADGRLQGRAGANVPPHGVQTMRPVLGAQRSSGGCSYV